MRQSKRIERVQAPIIPLVAQMIRDSPGTISLGQGVVSYGPPPQAFESVARFQEDPQLHKYQAVYGIPALVEAIEEKLGCENAINPRDGGRIVITAGGNMGFVNALLAIADPDDEVILQTPYYFNHEMAITMANARAVLVQTNGDSQLQPELIERAITERTRAIVTISPNNPTGAVYSESSLRRVSEMCRRSGLYHISDEAYEYFTYDGANHFSPGALPGAMDYTISLFSFSKSFGMASWRVGYMVIPEHLFDAINKIQDTILICPPVISQFAALGALEAGREYCAVHVARLSETRRLVRDALGSIDEFCRVLPAAGAFYYLLNLETEMDSVEVVSRLVRDFKVAAIPGSAFGVEAGCQLRVSYGALDRSSVAEGTDRLIRGLRSILRDK